MKRLLLILVYPCLLFSALDGNKDFQVWNRSTFQVSIFKGLGLRYDMEYRYGNGARQLYHKHFEGVGMYSINQYVQLGLGYRHMYNKIHSKWVPTLAPLGEAILFVPLKPFLLINRNRLEYRMIASEGDRQFYSIEADAQTGSHFFLYRNRTTLITKQISKRLPFNGYIADEFFWQTAKGINQNRILIGLLFPFKERVSGDIFYQKRFLKRENHWISQDIFGIYLAFFY